MKTIDDVIAAVNAKARDAGCDVRAGRISARRTEWDGIALTGGDRHQRDRAVAYIHTYCGKHFTSPRDLEQVTVVDHGDVGARTDRYWHIPVRSSKVRVVAFRDVRFSV